MLNRVTLLAMLASLGVTPLWADEAKTQPATPQADPLVFPDDQADANQLGRGWPGGLPPELIDLQKQLMDMRRGNAALGPAEIEAMRALQQQMVQKMRDHMAQLQVNNRGNIMQLGPGMVVRGDVMHAAPAQLEKAAFLGVTTSPVTAALRDQLNIAKGMGLLVELVEKDSPAEAASIKKHDILLKLGDQQIVNAEQFAVLVRSKKPGDEITLTLMREGKTQELKAKLAEKELPVLGAAPAEVEFQPAPGNVVVAPPIIIQGGGGPGFQKRESISVSAGPGGTKRTLQDNEHVVTVISNADGTTISAKTVDNQPVFDGPYNTDDDKKKVPDEVKAKVEKLLNGNHIKINKLGPGHHLELKPAPEAEAPPANANASAKSTLTRTDGQHSLTLNIENGQKTLVVKDLAAGKVIFDGPINTADERAKLPEGIAEKLKKLEAKAE